MAYLATIIIIIITTTISSSITTTPHQPNMSPPALVTSLPNHNPKHNETTPAQGVAETTWAGTKHSRHRQLMT
jgi:hypothetical protein